MGETRVDLPHLREDLRDAYPGAAEETILTETRLGRHHAATAWHLASGHPVKNPLSPLLDPGFIETTLRRHFQRLLDPDLADMLTGQYPRGVRFLVNDAPAEPETWHAPDRAPIAVRLPRKRRPAPAVRGDAARIRCISQAGTLRAQHPVRTASG